MLCLIARIDEAAREQLISLQRKAEQDFQIPLRHLHGHMTLLTYLGEEEENFIKACKDILQNQPPITFTYDRISVFAISSTIIAGAPKAGTLADFQNSLAHNFTEELDQWTRADAWVPHTTLLYRPDTDLEPIAEAMRSVFTPIPATISRIEFSKVLPGRFEIVDMVNLKS